MRSKVINSLREKPKNAHQLAQALEVDYKTIQHHLKVLYENKMVVVVNKDRYGAVYFLSNILEENMNDFVEIWKRFGKK